MEELDEAIDPDLLMAIELSKALMSQGEEGSLEDVPSVDRGSSSATQASEQGISIADSHSSYFESLSSVLQEDSVFRDTVAESASKALLPLRNTLAAYATAPPTDLETDKVVYLSAVAKLTWLCLAEQAPLVATGSNSSFIAAFGKACLDFSVNCLKSLCGPQLSKKEGSRGLANLELSQLVSLRTNLLGFLQMLISTANIGGHLAVMKQRREVKALKMPALGPLPVKEVPIAVENAPADSADSNLLSELLAVGVSSSSPSGDAEVSQHRLSPACRGNADHFLRGLQGPAKLLEASVHSLRAHVSSPADSDRLTRDIQQVRNVVKLLTEDDLFDDCSSLPLDVVDRTFEAAALMTLELLRLQMALARKGKGQIVDRKLLESSMSLAAKVDIPSYRAANLQAVVAGMIIRSIHEDPQLSPAQVVSADAPGGKDLSQSMVSLGLSICQKFWSPSVGVAASASSSSAPAARSEFTVAGFDILLQHSIDDVRSHICSATDVVDFGLRVLLWAIHLQPREIASPAPSAVPSPPPPPKGSKGRRTKKDRAKKKRSLADSSKELMPLAALFNEKASVEASCFFSDVATALVEIVSGSEGSISWARAHWLSGHTELLLLLLSRVRAADLPSARNMAYTFVAKGVLPVAALKEVLSKADLLSSSWPMRPATEHVLLAARAVVQLKACGHVEPSRAVLSGFLRNLQLHLWDVCIGEQPCSAEFSDLCLLIFHIDCPSDRAAVMANAAAAIHSVSEPSRAGDTKDILVLAHLIQLVSHMATYLQGANEEVMERLKSSLFRGDSSCAGVLNSDDSDAPFSEEARALLLPSRDVAGSFAGLLNLSCASNSKAIHGTAAPHSFSVCWSFLTRLHPGPLMGSDSLPSLAEDTSFVNSFQGLYAACKRMEGSPDELRTSVVTKLLPYSTSAVHALCEYCSTATDAPGGLFHASLASALFLLGSILNSLSETDSSAMDIDQGEGSLPSLLAEDRLPLISSLHKAAIAIKRYEEQARAAVTQGAISADLLELASAAFAAQIPRHVFRSALEGMSVSSETISCLLGFGAAPPEVGGALSPVDAVVAAHPPYGSDAVRLLSLKRCHLAILKMLLSLLTDAPVDAGELDPQLEAIIHTVLPLCNNASFEYLSRTATSCLHTIVSKQRATSFSGLFALDRQREFLSFIQQAELPSLPKNLKKLDACEPLTCHVVKVLHETITAPTEKLAPLLHALEAQSVRALPLAPAFKLQIHSVSTKFNVATLKMLCVALKVQGPLASSPVVLKRVAEELHELSAAEWRDFLVAKLFSTVGEEDSSATTAEVRSQVTRLLYSLCSNPIFQAVGSIIADQLLDLVPEAVLGWTACRTDYLLLTRAFAAQYGRLGKFVATISRVLESTQFTEQVSKGPLPGVAQLLKCLRDLLSGLYGKKEDSQRSYVKTEGGAKDGESLACKLCTYTATEDTFQLQHWYYCYTCKLTFTEGVCSVCAQVCHKGHELSYARQSRFYCDCGAGAKGISCKALKARSVSSEGAGLSSSTSSVPDLSSDSWLQQVSPEAVASVNSVIEGNDISSSLVTLLERLLATVDSLQSSDYASKPSRAIINCDSKPIVAKSDLFQPQKAAQSGLSVQLSLDQPEHSDLKGLFSATGAVRNALAMSSDGFVAVAELDSVDIGTVSGLLESGGRSSAKYSTVAKCPTAYPVLQMQFNPASPNFLAIAGASMCEVVTLAKNGTVQDRLRLELGMEGMGDAAVILRVMWVPGSQVQLAVVTNHFIKLYDLSADAISPQHFLTLIEDSIRDSTFVKKGDRVKLLTVGSSGMLYTHEIPVDASDGGPCIMIATIPLDATLAGKVGRSIHYSPHLDLVFASFADAKSFAGRLNFENDTFENTFALVRSSSTTYSCWVDIPQEHGAVMCIGTQKSAAVGMVLKEKEVLVQALRSSSPSNSVIGICGCPAAETPTALILLDDGSIHRFDVSGSSAPGNSDASSSTESASPSLSSASARRSGKSRKEGADALKKAIFASMKRKARDRKDAGKSSKAPPKDTEPAPTFPADFFENVDCVTDTIELGGDVLLCYSAEEAKSRLQKNDEYIVSPNKDMLTIEVSVPQPSSHVLVGVRVLVGNAAPEHVPKVLSVFGRCIPLKEGFRKWYDIPFTTEETLKGGNRFILRAVGCHTADKEPLIDSMEVYGLTKQAFGWTDKLKKFEAAAASAKRPKPSTDQEVALSDCCCLLTDIFSGVCKSSDPSNEAVSAKLMSLLPSSLNNYSLRAVHTPLKHLLAALFTDKAAYYRLKDAAQLTHIGDTVLNASSSPICVVRFEQYLETISKVVLLRPANFALFLQEFSLFPSAFSKMFWALHKENGWSSVVQVARQMMDALFGVLQFAYEGVQGKAALQPSFILLSKFLLSEDECLRFAATKRLIFLLSGSSDSADFIGTVEEAPVIRYCCDKCNSGTFIEGRRWHCNECEDLDLCDSCHDALSEALGDHLPHHKMTPYSPEGEVIVEEASASCEATTSAKPYGCEPNHFSSLSSSPSQQRKGDASMPIGADPEDEEGLLRIALAMSMDSSDVVMAEASNYEDAAQKHSLSSMLLQLLLEDMSSFSSDGYAMLAYGSVLFQLSQQSFAEQPSESGIVALVETLLSAVSFSTLLQSAQTKQEVALLVIKFFDALIMDPRKDTKSTMANPVSSKLGARGVQTALLSLCQQLVQGCSSGAFSKPAHRDTGQGKLLRPGTGRVAESIFPFFSKAFSKGKESLFDAVEVQLFNASLRLASHMYDAAAFSDCKEDWIDVLCTTILAGFDGIEAKHAKQLLRALCGSREEYHMVRDSRVFSIQEEKLRSISKTYQEFRVELAYADVVSLMQELKIVHKIAKSRPENWKPFIVARPSLLSFLLKSVFYFDEEPTSLCLEMIALAFMPDDEIQSRKKKSKKKAKSSVTGPVIEDVDMEEEGKSPSAAFSAIVSGLIDDGTLSRLVNVFLLEYNTVSVRQETSNILKWLWASCAPPDREKLFDMLSSKVPRLPSYGKNASEFIGLLSFVVTEVAKKTTAAEVDSMFGSMFEALQRALSEQNLLLSNHANSHVYRTLAGLVDFDGYYLESEPCLVCNDPEVPFSKCDLSSIRAEMKYTDSSILIKLDSSYSIKGITIHADDTKPSRMLRVINLYCNNKPVQDIVELRGNWGAWKKVQSCELKRKQSEFQVDFPIPVTATNFLIEYADFYEDVQAMASERLMCPRCSRIVHDKNGICRHCRENAHQCRQCRNINYENLNAFQCNECGHSKYGTFSFTFNARQSFASERMESTEDRDHGMEIINTESTNAYRRYQQVLSLKRHIVTVISLINTESSGESNDFLARFSVAASAQHGRVDPKVAMLASLYGKECKQAFDSLSQSARKLLATRRELVRFNSKASAKPEVVDAKARPPNSCFGCGNDFVALYLSFVDNVARQEHLRKVFVRQGLLQELLGNNLQGSAQLRATTRRVIALLTENNMPASTMLTELLKEKLRFCLQNHRSLDLASSVRNEIQLIIDLAAIEDDCWEHRFKLVVDLFFYALELGGSNPVMSEQVILPCLQYLSSVISPPVEQSGAKVVPPRGNPTIDYETWKAQQATFSAWRKAFSKSFIAGEGAFDDRTQIALRRVVNKWKVAAGLKPTFFILSSQPTASIDLGWMGQLLFSRSSRPVRVQVISLLEGLASSSARARAILLALCDLLPGASAHGDGAAEFFALFKKLIEPMDCRVFLARRNFLLTLTELVAKEVAHIRGQESTFTSDISQGFVLKTYISILLKMLELPGTRRLYKTKKLTVSLLNSFLSLRGVIVQKTKLTEDSSTMLLDLLKSLHADNEKDNQLFITGCIKALDTHNKGREPIFIFEQLCNIVCPEKPKPQYYVNLIKSPTQEEFIRGSLNKNPYLVTDIGGLMQDVKDKICRDLELYMELQMELLVCNKIISLEMPVDLVFEQVWLKDPRNEGIENNEDAPPMDVIYRLQGLDGEATEDIVESLETSDGDELDPEEQYKVASIMCECGGLEAMVRQIEGISDFKEDMELARLVLRLLYNSLKLKVNREAIVRMGNITVLLDKLMLVFPNESQAEIADLLLLTVETIVIEANHLQEEERSGGSAAAGGLRRNRSFNELACKEDDVNEKRSQMETFLSKIGSPLVRCNPRIVKSMTRIIPVLTYGMRPIEETLVQYFTEFTAFADFDKLPFEDETRRFHLQCFSEVAGSIQADENGLRLKRLFLELGVTQTLFDYLHATLPKQTYAAAEWTEAVEKRSLPYVLPILAGLTQSVEEAQCLALQNNLVPRLHHMAGLSTKNKVGNLAEALLEALRTDCAAVTTFLDEHEAAEKQKKKEEALKHRQRVLSAMGITQETSTRLVPASQLDDSIDEDEEGFTCRVCREGYAFMPKNPMGFYVYCTRVPLVPDAGRQDHGYRTVTNFNTIHFSCHRDAVKADANLRPRKEEWEGAMLRNSSTLCNNIFPMLGPDTPVEDYASHVEAYFQNQAQNCGRCESTKFRLVAHDLSALLLRFAREESFSSDSRGGSKESNIQSTPFFMQMGSFLLNASGGAQRTVHQQALSQFLAQVKSPVEFWLEASKQANSPLYFITTTLFLLSLEEWRMCRLYLLKRAIVHALVEARVDAQAADAQDEKEEKTEADETEKIFAKVRYALLFFQLVNNLQEVLKEGEPGPKPSSPGSDIEHLPDAAWIKSLEERIRTQGHVLAEKCREVVQEFEEFGRFNYESADEFLDDLEIRLDAEEAVSATSLLVALEEAAGKAK